MTLAAIQRISAASGTASRRPLHGVQDDLRQKARVRELGRALLKRLGAYALQKTDLCDAPGPILLKHDGAGRPFLCAGASGQILFPPGFCSLSHGKNALLAVVSDVPVGCDVERMLRGDAPLQALSGFFSEADLRCIRGIGESQARSLALTRLWTRKEAVYKLAGKLPRDRLCLLDAERTQRTLGVSFTERITDGESLSTIALRSPEAAVRWMILPDCQPAL